MGSFSSLEDAASLKRITPVSIVLLSIDRGQEWGAALMVRARNAGFHGNILVVTSGLGDREMLELMEKGCAGIFLKSQPISMLHQRIRSIASDRPRPTAILATMERVETRVPPIFTRRKRPLIIFNGS
jgi:DNA-binding NarL/FixJ family response regulator